AIGDPVFNLHVRDSLIDWTVKDRSKRLVNIMDAYVLGALPPYNMLLGGKLVACLLRTRDTTMILQKPMAARRASFPSRKRRARLLAITTSSSMGRSSVYNRLKLGGFEYFKSIGYTGGWGHFHIPDSLFLDLRDYLRHIDHSYADRNRFGQGPNWRLRTTRAALAALGFKEDMLRHGIQREVFLCQLASNATKLLHSGKGRPNLTSLLTAEEVSDLAIERWIVPRALRRPEFKEWEAENIAVLLGDQRAKLLAMLARTG
ncbi:MAG: Druantia anti-phage system protein DruA, partial [Stellaceae bacterium]